MRRPKRVAFNQVALAWTTRVTAVCASELVELSRKLPVAVERKSRLKSDRRLQ